MFAIYSFGLCVELGDLVFSLQVISRGGPANRRPQLNGERIFLFYFFFFTFLLFWDKKYIAERQQAPTTPCIIYVLVLCQETVF